ncbi:SLC13 family permease [Streptomonospora alba]|uniref:SLC13 family permease n=1 Tax=Streptomonospora alba TaxID=183763 RepID=UPI00069B3A32|nr:SLC13 family permease [Streptomonospora alba]
MTIADASIVVLLVLFAATALPGFNLGMAAFAAAFLVGLAAGVASEDVTGFFPGDFFVLIVGVTALFAVAKINGTLDWLLDGLLRLVGGRVVLVALVPFVAGALLAAFGTLPAAATAIVAPIALGLAGRYGLPPLMMALLGIMGILSGLLSPLAVYGVTARQQAAANGIALPDHAPLTLLAGSLAAGAAVCIGALVVARLRRLLPTGTALLRGEPEGSPVPGRPGGGAAPDEAAESAGAPSSMVRLVTLGGMAAVLVLSVGFDMNIGYLGLTAACLQLLLLRIDPGPAVARMPWGVVLLIGGLLTYIGVMQELGAFERISELLTIESSAMLTLLLLCYIAGITSFAASSIAVFVTAMPLVPAVVESGVPPVGALLAVALSSVVVDINPLGITGGLILGAAPEETRARLFRQLLFYGLASVAVGPLLVWAAFGWW